MAASIIKRLLSLVLTLFLVSAAVYAIASAIPGQRSQILMGDAVTSYSSGIQDEWPGYFDWLSRVLRLDFGRSAFGSQDVCSLIASRIPLTAVLSLISLALALAISLSMTALVRLDRSRLSRFLYNTVSTGSMSLPSFILALLLILVFAVALGLLPSGGYVPFSADPVRCIRSLILPSFSLALIHCGLIMRITDSALEREERRAYVSSARSRGLGEWRIVGIHEGVNILGELAAVSMQSLAGLFTSSAAVEYIFALPGLGSLTVEAVGRRDVPTIVALVLLGTLVSAVCGAIGDLAGDRGRGRTRL